jgi:transcriptional regulator with XRE-family HTH domain
MIQMLQFSEQLRKFINQRGIKIYALAQTSGIDRTLIQKMLKGERLPAEQTVVQELAQSLMLTPEETEALLLSYYVSKMGEGTYARRKYVKDFFNHFDNFAYESKIHIDVSSSHPAENLPDDNVIYGRHNIYSALAN